ncbi:MAG: hypothetical protein JWN70_5368 [Planctomycetaceae bacterium]|nr:hypothetical protein [Planctomycetaceae bacterium]
MDRHCLRPYAAWGLVAAVLMMCGCSMFPEALQPQNLQKLNRGSAPSSDPFFSVPAYHHSAYAPDPNMSADANGDPECEQPE